MLNIEQREITAQTKRHWVRLTRVCNNRCIFCLDKNVQDGVFLPLGEINVELQRGRSLGIERVILSGGEATTHPEFLRIVNMAKESGYKHIQVITNGRMFAYSKFLRQVVKNGVLEITFSMHGHNNKLHDRQTQVQGSFQQSLTGLVKALKIKGLIISVDIVINRINVRYLADILKFFINLGVYEFDLLQVVPFGQAWDNRNKVFYDVEELLPFLQKAFALSTNPDVHIWTNRFPPKYLGGFEYLIQHPVKLYDEIGGRRDMFSEFLNKGRMMNCRGERCLYCFLGNFCKDLVELKRRGELFSHNYPFCLRKSKEFQNSKKRKKYTLKNKKRNIFKFLSFYINHRYFIKGLKCDECKFNSQCAGMQCGYIRKFGFRTLSPVLDKKTKDKWAVAKKNLPYCLLRLSLACNADCLFCNVPPESYLFKSMSTQQAKAEIDRLIALDKELKLDITGGEPTLRSDLEELIKYASKKGTKVIELQTNGISLADKEYVKRLKAAGLNQAFIALHSSIPKIHDYLVGEKGAFEKCISGIKNLLEFNVEVVLNPVITTKNYTRLPNYIKFIKNHFPQIKSISLSVVQPRGRAWKNKYLIPRYKTISPYIRKTLCLGKEYNLIINNPYCGVPLCIGGWYHYLEQCDEYRQPLSESISKIEQDNYITDKIKGAVCFNCDLSNFCNGVWKEYAVIYSFSDLRSIQLKKRTVIY